MPSALNFLFFRLVCLSFIMGCMICYLSFAISFSFKFSTPMSIWPMVLLQVIYYVSVMMFASSVKAAS